MLCVLAVSRRMVTEVPLMAYSVEKLAFKFTGWSA